MKIKTPRLLQDTPKLSQARLQESEVILVHVHVARSADFNRLVALTLKSSPVAIVIANGFDSMKRLALTCVEGGIHVDQIEAFIGKAVEDTQIVTEYHLAYLGCQY